ncbi:MAG: proline dehydrogenase family protein [Candidatus Marinimicrobia bacterium]|nr:proline dehydrogenase family protein [Candidatus Neomarinimicrobiota bacterium]
MLSILNSAIIKTTTLLPKSIVQLFAGKYVAGENHNTALNVVKSLNEQGYSATIDILGEHVETISEANQITNEYLKLYDEIAEAQLDCNISIKPSHIGLDLGENEFLRNLALLIDKAKSHDNFLRIDMESSMVTDITIKAYEIMLKSSTAVGTVFQAYLFRTLDDIKNIQNDHLNFRLCKGIYKESKDISIQDRNHINENYLKILRYSFIAKNYVGIATHDINLLKDVYVLIEELNVSPENFEFQVLYGVPMSGWLEKHLEMGYKVRVYVPFGPDWYDYSIRRLKENPNIAGYVIKNLFR